MKFVFTNHAKYRIMERGIIVDRIKQTLLDQSVRKTDKYGMITSRKKFGLKTLEVVYRVEKNSYIIITAYYEN